jgi:hypothetical protein
MYYAIERIKLRVAGRLHEAEVETYKPLESEFGVIDTD